MKRIGCLMLLVVLLSSCGQKLEEAILGSWEIVELKPELEVEYLAANSRFGLLSRSMSGTKFRFKDDGFYIEKSKSEKTSLSRYKVFSEENRILLESGGTFELDMKVSQISGNTMKWFIDLEDVGGARMILKRIPDFEENLFN